MTPTSTSSDAYLPYAETWARYWTSRNPDPRFNPAASLIRALDRVRHDNHQQRIRLEQQDIRTEEMRTLLESITTKLDAMTEPLNNLRSPQWVTTANDSTTTGTQTNPHLPSVPNSKSDHHATESDSASNPTAGPTPTTTTGSGPAASGSSTSGAH